MSASGAAGPVDDPLPIELPTTWRVRHSTLTTAKWGVAVFGTTAAGSIAWTTLFPTADRPAGLLILAFCAVMGTFTWFAALRPYLRLTQTEIVVRNPVTTTRIPLDDVVDATPGYSGIVITRASAPPVAAWAVQQSNLATWLGRPTRARDVARVVMIVARHRQAVAPGARVPRIGQEETTPFDAMRSSLPYPWRMTRVEATLVDFFRHSSVPVIAGIAATFWTVVAPIFLTVAYDDWRHGQFLDHDQLGVMGVVFGLVALVTATGSWKWWHWLRAQPAPSAGPEHRGRHAG